ncbi:MAG: hydroxymethylbilane synthase, partial [Thermicanus sp.]|nr:hydroxymethylbilane synthase [Thermicanus sp.]
GLERMGWTGEVTEIIPTEIMLPAVGQGALGIEGRWEGEATSFLQTIHDPITAVTTAAERAFLYRLEGGCQVPIAAFARWEEGEIRLQGLVASPDGKEIFRGERRGKEAERVGKMLAEELLEEGAGEVLKRFGG